MLVSSTADTCRSDANASQVMKTVNITAVSEINEPIEEIVFHAVYASGFKQQSRCCCKRYILRCDWHLNQ